jgi:toxin ParE1/3/4
MRVQYTRPASKRLAELVGELRAVNPFAVKRLAKSLTRSLRRLSSFPRSGSPVREFSGLGLREFIVEPYRFFYSVDDARQTVWIVDVWHGAQLPAEPRLPAGREPEPAHE